MVLCSDPNSGFQGAEKTGSDVSDQPRNPLARKHPVGAPLRSPNEAGAQAGREPAPARFGGLFPYDSESQTLEFSPCLQESGPGCLRSLRPGCRHSPPRARLVSVRHLGHGSSRQAVGPPPRSEPRGLSSFSAAAGGCFPLLCSQCSLVLKGRRPDEGAGSGRDKRNRQEVVTSGIKSFIVTEKQRLAELQGQSLQKTVGDESQAGGREGAGNAKHF